MSQSQIDWKAHFVDTFVRICSSTVQWTHIQIGCFDAMDKRILRQLRSQVSIGATPIGIYQSCTLYNSISPSQQVKILNQSQRWTLVYGLVKCLLYGRLLFMSVALLGSCDLDSNPLWMPLDGGTTRYGAILNRISNGYVCVLHTISVGSG